MSQMIILFLSAVGSVVVVFRVFSKNGLFDEKDIGGRVIFTLISLACLAGSYCWCVEQFGFGHLKQVSGLKTSTIYRVVGQVDLPDRNKVAVVLADAEDKIVVVESGLLLLKDVGFVRAKRVNTGEISWKLEPIVVSVRENIPSP